METSVPAVIRIEGVLTSAIDAAGRHVLAVSGGRDSMVLLDAVARLPLTGALTVATFDHGTGAAASRAVQVVAEESAARGLPVVIGRAERVHRAEAGWRAERWKFLREVALAERARVVTAHTLDDQLETVVIRVLRDAGARGLAGLYAPSDVLRPLLPVSRGEVADYSQARVVRYVEDPTNQSPRYLRNRVRLNLLPAIQRVRPQFAEEMLAVSRRAAVWRRQLASLPDSLDLMFLNPHTVRIAAESLEGYDAASLRILWPEVAARAEVTMDRRGTERAAAFTIQSVEARKHSGGRLGGVRPGGRGRVIQLAGGAEIEFVGGAFVLRRA